MLDCSPAGILVGFLLGCPGHDSKLPTQGDTVGYVTDRIVDKITKDNEAFNVSLNRVADSRIKDFLAGQRHQLIALRKKMNEDHAKGNVDSANGGKQDTA